MKARLQEFEGLLATLGQALHPDEHASHSIGLAAAAAVAKPGLAAANGSMSAREETSDKARSMNHSRPQRAAAGDQDPHTGYSGIHSIMDSTGGWRWIVSAADIDGKARSFPVDAGKHSFPACQIKHCFKGP